MRGYACTQIFLLAGVNQGKVAYKVKSYLSKNNIVRTTYKIGGDPTQRAIHLALAVDLWVTYVVG